MQLFFATFAVINLFCLYLFFFTAYDSLPPLVQAAMLIIALFAAYPFFASLSVGGRWAKGVISIVGVLFSVNIAWFVEQSYPTKEPPLVLAEGKTSSPKIKIVDFQQKPNVYFISFDAMIPESLAKKYLNINELPYQSFMRKNGFRRFRNAFSDYPRTRETLNHLLAMTPDYFQTLIRQGRHLDLFTGLSPSPAFEIFKANGYTTNTYFRDQYMGDKTGPHVDNYKVNKYYFGFCKNHPTVKALNFGFFSFCLLSWSNLWMRDFFGVINDSSVGESTVFHYVDTVLEDFSRQLSTDKPFISFVHIISPDHTPIPFKQSQFDEYRKQVLLNFNDETPRLMEKVFNFIQANDPNAFIYFYSDHGQYLSRRIPANEFQGLSQKDKEFFIQDRYGILAAFYPPGICTEYFEAPMMKPFVTNAKVLRQVIRCLADGDDPIITPIEYRLHQTHRGYQGDEPGYYEDYLYE